MTFNLGLILIQVFVLFDALALECDKEETVLDKYFVPKKIRKLVTYQDISIYYFEIPEDVCEFIFSLKAYGSSGDMYDPDPACSSENVHVFLKYGSIPVIVPGDYPFPNTFMDPNSRLKSYSITFKSQTDYADITIKQPEPGKWFAIAFKPYQDPKDDKISQQGLSKQCTTYGYGNLSIKYLHSKFITSDKLYLNEFLNNSIRFYRFYNPSNFYLGNLLLTSSNKDTRIKIYATNKAVGKVENDNSSVLVKNSTQFTFLIIPKSFNYFSLQMIGIDSNLTFNLSLSLSSEISATHYFPLVRKSFGDLSSFEYLSLQNFNKFSLIQGSPIKVTFVIEDVVDTGGTLTIRITKEFEELELCRSQLLLCLNRDVPSTPISPESCVLGLTNISKPILLNEKQIVHIPYPESGRWFLTFDVFCQSKGSNLTATTGIYNLLIFSSHCIAGGCSENGKCAISEDSGVLYTFCYCIRGYKGWDCSNNRNLDSNISPIFATLLLTLSNLFFVPSVIFATIRGLYTEAIVYFFGMLFSITYHACDEQEIRSSFCNTYIDLLQFADFYCNLLGIWVTPVAMAKLAPRYTSIAHILGAIFIAFGTLWDKHSYLLSVVPAAFGLMLILYSWIHRCCKYRRLFPSKKYLTVCLPIGTAMVSFALICYTLLQTKRNYHMVHSVWHMVMALSLLFLLPGKRDLQENWN